MLVAGPIVHTIPVFLVGCLLVAVVYGSMPHGEERASMSREARHASRLVDSNGRVCNCRGTCLNGDGSLFMFGLSGGLAVNSLDDIHFSNYNSIWLIAEYGVDIFNFSLHTVSPSLLFAPIIPFAFAVRLKTDYTAIAVPFVLTCLHSVTIN